MLAISKQHIAFIRRDKLRACYLACARIFTHFVEPEAVELFGVGEYGWVKADGIGRYFDDHASGDVLAVGERKGLANVASKGSWEAVSFFCYTTTISGQGETF